MKNILITGSSRGLGFELAKKFIAEGNNVVINGRDSKTLNAAKKQLKCDGFVFDVSHEESAKSLVKSSEDSLGRLDAIVCNVGSGKSVPKGEESLKEWRRMIDVNLFASVNVINAASKYSNSKKISVVCISSICGIKSISNAPIAYSVAKSALNSYVQMNATYLLSKGIRINCVAPGNLMFDGSTWEKKMNENPKFVETIISETPLKRLGKPEDIFGAVDFLISEESSYMVGVIMVVDGGISL